MDPNPPIRLTNRRRGGWPLTVLRALFVTVVVAVLGAGAAGAGLYVHFARDLPRLDQFDAMSGSSVTRLHAADGQLVGEWYEQRRVAVRWDQLPERLVLAFLAAEDVRFFSHSGVDLKGVIRAVVANVQSGTHSEGASTITQQLAKTLVGADKSYERKVKEAILARRMEDLYSKTQILTWYLNVIYLGHGSYGVQAASQNYFRKNVWGLSLAEMAMIAGMPQSPSRVNPAVNLPAARARMGHVLDNMVEQGWISAAEAATARDAPMRVYPLRDTLGDHTPYYTETVRKDIAARHAEPGRSWLTRGLTVEMGVEPSLQRAAQQALGRGLEALAKKQGYAGPLARLEQADFFARNRPKAISRKGERGLGWVASVTKDAVRVELSPEVAGTLTLKNTSWAAPYSTLPPGASDATKVSFNGRLKDMRTAFSPGDVVPIEIVGGDAGAPDVRLIPIPEMEGALISYALDGSGLDAMVGGWDFDRSQVNRAYALRQNGSLMKPIVYSRAYDAGLPTSAIVSGAPYITGDVVVRGKKSQDDEMAFIALAKSRKEVSQRVLDFAVRRGGDEDYRDWGRRLGLSQPLKAHYDRRNDKVEYSSEVRGSDQRPIDMAHAYGVFARRGVAPDLGLIRRVIDREGRVLERHISPMDAHASTGDTLLALWDAIRSPVDRRIPEDTAWLTARNLADVVRRGTGKRAKKLGREAAGKTGTLDFDVWFVGFTAERLGVAWIGADKRRRPVGLSKGVNKVYGGDTALPVWLDFMTVASGDREARPVGGDAPDTIVTVRVDPETGLRARTGGEAIPHRRGTEPTDFTFERVSADNIGEIETEF